MAQEIGELQFVGRVAQKAIIVKDGKVLLVRNVGKIEEVWDFPGGRLHVDERPDAGLVRELTEELGVEVAILRPLMTSTFSMHGTNNPHFLVVYICSLVSDEPFKLASDEIAEAKWFALSDVDTLELFPSYREALKMYIEQTKV